MRERFRLLQPLYKSFDSVRLLLEAEPEGVHANLLFIYVIPGILSVRLDMEALLPVKEQAGEYVHFETGECRVNGVIERFTHIRSETLWQLEIISTP